MTRFSMQKTASILLIAFINSCSPQVQEKSVPQSPLDCVYIGPIPNLTDTSQLKIEPLKTDDRESIKHN
jgi:hypothetical protein